MILDLNDKTISYQIKGKGNPILLVHGWGGSSKSLETLAQLLSGKYKTIIIDLPGFGSSSKPDPSWGIDEYSNLLVDFIDKLNVKPVVFFGHSFGGTLGIFIASKYPSYISKLILCAASYKRNAPSTAKISKYFIWVPPILKIIIYKLLFPQSDLYKIPELQVNFRKIVSRDLTPVLKTIKTPSLILWGEKDSQTPASYALELKKNLNSSRLKIFPEIGHNLPLQHPQLVYQEIKKFI